MRNSKLLLLWFSLLLPALGWAAAPESFTVGTLHVSRYGTHGRPLILIPGLGSGAWVWQETIQHFEKDHVIYAVTLAGFDGTPPPPKGNYFEQADTALLKLIQSRHITEPVLVGHSLGGTLSIGFAEKHSNLLSAVVAVDGLPVFPGTQTMTAQQRQQIAAGMQKQMSAMTPTMFVKSQGDYMATIGVLNPGLAAKLAVLQAKSNQTAFAQYAAEDMQTDSRAGLAGISVPLLEISPYNAPDFSAGPMKMSAQQKATLYAALLKGAPQAQVVTIEPSRHFVMYDQPAKWRETLAKFLASLPQN